MRWMWKIHAGGIANCYTDAERILRERDEALAAKGAKGDGKGGRRRTRPRGRGAGGEQAHPTIAPGNAAQVTQQQQPTLGAQGTQQAPTQAAAPTAVAQEVNSVTVQNGAGGRDRLAEAVAMLLHARENVHMTKENDHGFTIIDGGDDDDPPDKNRRTVNVPKDPKREKRRVKREKGDDKASSRASKTQVKQESDSEMSDADDD